MNPYNWRQDYDNANWDIRHRFVTSFIYDLPRLNGTNSVLRWTLGSWQANGIFTAQSGIPINVIIAADQANIGRRVHRCRFWTAHRDNIDQRSGHEAFGDRGGAVE